ncbi:hypothetical protein NLU13_1704 [Sarocladium strictum]|uniref:CWH43-like N-terminal domain-containing protein n=1 Tax=Sarocladium strictum TaxID=5046 RepID=A0AA39LC15_SARSR|nr:hypothetical protein NLU13_1704 [Sarocladium strictum]
MAVKGVFSYWWLPVLASVVWLSMLLGMLLHWIINTNSRHYPSMRRGQHIAFISDIGAQELKPMFITMCAVCTVLFDLSFAAEMWLRKKGRLAPNKSMGEKVLMGMTIVFAIVGTAGLILLAIFDTLRHNTLHNIFLLLFIGGYWISAIFICAEYQRLGIKYREHRILRISFWIKLTFILAELFLVIAFASTSWTGHRNVAAVLEWIVALVFTFYVLSYAIDLWPAVRTKDRRQRFVKPREMEEASPSPAERDAEPAASGY